MTILAFSALLFIFSIVAGLLGALTGLGGGVIIIPVLVLLFNVDLYYAMGASLISVIATSSGTSIALMKEGYANLRIGMFLEAPAVIGALIGALLIAIVSQTVLALLFCAVLFFSAYLTVKRKEDQEIHANSHSWGVKFQLEGTNYKVQNVPTGLVLMTVAGLISGLLGIGSGTIKVLIMDQVLRIPYKVAAATSNFMIGITGAVSAGIYFSQGYIEPLIVFPVLLGVLLGAFAGASLLPRIRTRFLRILFSVLLCLIGLEMLYKIVGGN